ncbi:MAG TPA: AbrB/MazE/SpoVT family DNA-binding domain-containing protein [Usitatibacter sp.]|nr:AbrB/MazE/SpoVT family DNA-binding domain-containing protein [Usitatibacter sp.]
MATATLTSKGQITIPKTVCEGLGVDAGDRIEFVESGGGVYTVVAATRDLQELKGAFPNPASP